MRCRSFLRLLVAFCANLAAAGLSADAPAPNELGRLIIKNFSPRTFQGQPQVWSTAQDDTGVLFFGNDPGVLTYDGATWRSVAAAGHVNPSFGVARGADGRIYASGFNEFGWLRPLGNGQHEFVSLVPQLPPAEREFQQIFNVIAAGDAIYAATATKVLVWRQGRFTSVRTPPLARLRSAAGVVYLQAPRQPLQRFDGERLVPMSDDPFFLANEMKFLGAAPGGGLLIGTDNHGLSTLRDGRIAPWPTEADAALRAKRIYRGAQLPDGSLVLAHETGGATLLAADGRFLSSLDDSNGLMVARVIDAFADRERGLWLTLNGGLAHAEWPATATLFDKTNGLDNGNVNDVKRHAGVLWAATAQGLYRLVPASAPQTNAQFERVLAGAFFSLLSDGGDLFAASRDELFELQPSGFVPIAKLTGAAYVLRKSRRDPARLWLGEQLGLHSLRRTATGWVDEGYVPEVKEVVRSLGEDAAGRLWGSTRGRGFFRRTEVPGAAPHIERFPGGHGLPAQPGLCGVNEWGGQLYFTTSGCRTPFIFDEAQQLFTPLTAIEPLPAGHELAPVFQGRENPAHLWLAVSGERIRGWQLFELQRGGGRRALPQSLAQLISSFNVIHEETSAAGTVLWVGGTEGLLRIDLAQAFPPAVPFGAAVWADGVPPGGQRAFSTGALNFEFVAPRYTADESVEYQTLLTGYETAPTPWSRDRRRTFTNLPEGRYRFEVRARDPAGHLAAPATLSFTILPPWWRTWWAHSSYGVGGVLLLAGLVSARTRVLRRRNEQLEKLVALRTDDLRWQNAELARLHKLELDEKITARLGEEKARLEVLRYQLNPHFLFNSLTSIRSQIPPALATARETLDRLADFCRLTLHGRKHAELTTVGEELPLLRTYLDIEQTRMGELLSVAFEVDPTLDAEPLPRLLLLPLVENALKYGQATSPDTLALRLTARRAPAGMIFEIANTGEWVERGSRQDLPSMGIGHENLTERLLRHYPGAHEFTHEAKDGWVTVRLTLTGLKAG